MAKSSDTPKKTKRPTALKRDIRNEKRRLINKAFKSKVRTTLRRFEESLAGDDKAAVQERLNAVYAMMDKGLKRGIYKKNKVGRVKSRLTARAMAKIA